jgi:hypothetical protein
MNACSRPGKYKQITIAGHHWQGRVIAPDLQHTKKITSTEFHWRVQIIAQDVQTPKQKQSPHSTDKVEQWLKICNIQANSNHRTPPTRSRDCSRPAKYKHITITGLHWHDPNLRNCFMFLWSYWSQVAFGSGVSYSLPVDAAQGQAVQASKQVTKTPDSVVAYELEVGHQSGAIEIPFSINIEGSLITFKRWVYIQNANGTSGGRG